MWAHIYLAKNGAVPWKSEEGYSARYILRTFPLLLRLFQCQQFQLRLLPFRDVVFKSHQLSVRRGYNHTEKSIRMPHDSNAPMNVSSDCNFEYFWKPSLDLNIIDMHKPYPHVPNETLHDYAGECDIGFVQKNGQPHVLTILPYSCSHPNPNRRIHGV